jgi:hypothetical protein
VSKPLPSLASPESPIYVGKNVSPVAEKVIVNDQDELPLNVATPMSSAERSNQRSVINSNSVTTTDQNIGKNSLFFFFFFFLGIKNLMQGLKFTIFLFILYLMCIYWGRHSVAFLIGYPYMCFLL